MQHVQAVQSVHLVEAAIICFINSVLRDVAWVFLHLGQNVSVRCSFKLIESQKKKACPSLCQSCTSASVCTLCIPNYGLNNDRCMECPIGTYLPASGGDCEGND